jgi:hypothetical protein
MQLAEMKQDRFFVYAMPILRVMGLPVQVSFCPFSFGHCVVSPPSIYGF